MNRAAVLFIAWLIALAALITTLYASEILQLPVCVLCWYQRIAMYPLVIILGIGAYLNDATSIRYALVFPIIGFIFSAYQYAEQMIPGFSPIALCQQAIPCNDIHIKLLGFMTIPFFSMAAFFFILICLLIARKCPS